MSMYNMFNGYEPTAPLVLRIMGLLPKTIPRFRDAYFTYRDRANPDPVKMAESDPIMVLLTRTGGGNRPKYETENSALCTLPGYIDNADDQFDHSFALFRYELPQQLHELARTILHDNGPPLTLREKTEQIISGDATVRQKQATERLVETLKQVIKRDDGKDVIITL